MLNLRHSSKEACPTSPGDTNGESTAGVIGESDKEISSKCGPELKSFCGVGSTNSGSSVMDKNNGREAQASSCNIISGETRQIVVPNGIGPIVCDRKRKERHESFSQEKEKKVIRSQSHDDPKADIEEKLPDVRRTRSSGNFPASGDHENEMLQGETFENQGNANKVDASELPYDCKSTNTFICDQSLPKVSTECVVDSALYGSGSYINPQYGIVRTMPIHFEAEIQRQWERSAQYNSGSTRKVLGYRKRKDVAGKAGFESTSAIEFAKDAGEDELSGIDHHQNNLDKLEDELPSPSSEESSSSSIISFEDGDADIATKNCTCLIPEDDIEADLEEFRIEENELRVHTSSKFTKESQPMLDLATLHHQIESTAPISFLDALHGPQGIDDQVMLSPRNSVLIKEASDLPPSPPRHQAPLDPPLSRQIGSNGSIKLNQLSKQVHYFKKQLKFLEDEHEKLMGYKPSHADKLNHKEMRKCLLQLTKAKRELKQIRDDPIKLSTGELPGTRCGSNGVMMRDNAQTLKSLDATVKEISALMIEKRKATSRPEDPMMMTASELAEEKSSMQKQLLLLEKKHGRPSSKEEKDIVRCLYDRYRTLKKSGARFGNVKENSLDLAPIMEHEPLEFSTNNGKSRISMHELRKEAVVMPVTNNSPRRRRRLVFHDEEDNEGDGGPSIINIRNEGFTEMTLVDLEANLRNAKEEKRKLRTILRKFETEFQATTGRPPQKEEKYSSAEMEATYHKYKRCRATVRLLDVLIAKQKYPHLLTEFRKIDD